MGNDRPTIHRPDPSFHDLIVKVVEHSADLSLPLQTAIAHYLDCQTAPRMVIKGNPDIDRIIKEGL